MRQIGFHELLGHVNRLARTIKGFSEDKELPIRVFLHGQEDFDVYSWASWEDSQTGEKLIFFESRDRCVLTDLRNINRIEFLYEKSESEPKRIGYRGRVEEITGE